MSKVAWIGLGTMGFPMAGHLKTRGGHAVTVFNRTRAKADAWVAKFGGTSAPSPAEAADGADFVFSCVGNDDDLRAVTLGRDGVFQALRRGAVFIDHTTASAGIARELHAAAKERGAGALDAPVSGGQAGAENGTLTVMVGGDAADFDSTKPVIEAYARAVNLIGATGSGQLTKMVNQICIGGLIEALAEALHFAKRAGLDVEEGGRRRSPKARPSPGRWTIAGRRCSTANSISASPSTGCARISRSCSRRRARMAPNSPVTALVDQFYAEIQAMGGGRWDTSSLIARLERK